jgi:hypothetical protein
MATAEFLTTESTEITEDQKLFTAKGAKDAKKKARNLTFATAH